jgi:hypothetical protein
MLEQNLPHLDCTGEQRRIQICQEYKVDADDCILLYGGMTKISDANNREIRDKYYQFSCTPNGKEHPTHVITCGSGAARHFCVLTNQPMPHAFNPFVHGVVETAFPANNGENDVVDSIENDNDGNVVGWNPLRRKFYYAVQLFIIRYQKNIRPGTKIFRVLHLICESDKIRFRPQRFHYEMFIEVVIGFNTNIPKIITELEEHGAVRAFDFTDLAKEAEQYLQKGQYNIFMN